MLVDKNGKRVRSADFEPFVCTDNFKDCIFCENAKVYTNIFGQVFVDCTKKEEADNEHQDCEFFKDCESQETESFDDYLEKHKESLIYTGDILKKAFKDEEFVNLWLNSFSRVIDLKGRDEK